MSDRETVRKVAAALHDFRQYPPAPDPTGLGGTCMLCDLPVTPEQKGVVVAGGADGAVWAADMHRECAGKIRHEQERAGGRK